MSDEKTYSYTQFLELRGIEMKSGDEPCSQCGGFGTHTYGNTSTWMHGIGGQTLTLDVCDRCWGSGNEAKPWANLRKIKAEYANTATYLSTLLVIKTAIDTFDKKCKEIDTEEVWEMLNTFRTIIDRTMAQRPCMMNKFRQHVPAFIDIDEPIPTIEFEGTEMLLAIDVVSQWTESLDGEKFSHFALSDNRLMAIYNNGLRWLVVGFIERPEEVLLPQWDHTKPSP